MTQRLDSQGKTCAERSGLSAFERALPATVILEKDAPDPLIFHFAKLNSTGNICGRHPHASV